MTLQEQFLALHLKLEKLAAKSERLEIEQAESARSRRDQSLALSNRSGSASQSTFDEFERRNEERHQEVMTALRLLAEYKVLTTELEQAELFSAALEVRRSKRGDLNKPN